MDAVQVKRMEQARKAQPALHDAPAEVVERLVDGLAPELRDPFLFVAWQKSGYRRHSTGFRTLARRRFTEPPVELVLAWCRTSGSRWPLLPSDYDDLFGEEAEREALERIVRELPDDSPAVLAAADALVWRKLRGELLSRWEATWEMLSPAIEEALEFFRRTDLITRQTAYPLHVPRIHWLDRRRPLFRSILWRALDHSLQPGLFAAGEILRDLPQALLHGLSLRGDALRAVLTGDGETGELTVRWHPSAEESGTPAAEFALLFRCDDGRALQAARLLLLRELPAFETGPEVRLPEVRRLLRAGRQAAYLLLRGERSGVTCVSATLAEELLAGERPVSRVARRIRCPEVAEYASPFAAFLADRLITLEAGEPIQVHRDEPIEILVERAVAGYAPTTQGVLTLDMRLSSIEQGSEVT
jgi:hypothetical protein